MADNKLSPAERFKEMLDAAKEKDSFHVDAAKLELSEQIYIVMEEKGVSEAELSRRLAVSRAYVNKILQGSANLTIESLVKIGRALETEFKFAFGSFVEQSDDVLDTEYIYEKASVAKELVRPVHQNVYDFSQYKLTPSKDVSVAESTESEYARSEIAA